MCRGTVLLEHREDVCAAEAALGVDLDVVRTGACCGELQPRVIARAAVEVVGIVYPASALGMETAGGLVGAVQRRVIRVDVEPSSSGSGNVAVPEPSPRTSSTYVSPATSSTRIQSVSHDGSILARVGSPKQLPTSTDAEVLKSATGSFARGDVLAIKNIDLNEWVPGDWTRT